MARRSAPSPSRCVAKLWRSACGETRGVPVSSSRRVEQAAHGARAQAQAAPGRRTAPRRPRSPPRRRAAAAAVVRCGRPGVERRARLAADRHDPVLAALALADADVARGRRRPRRRRGRGRTPRTRAGRRRRSPRTARSPARAGRPRRPAAGRSPSSSRPTSSLPRNSGSRLARLGARSAATGLLRTSRRRTARRKNARSEESLRPMVTASFAPWSDAR